MQNTKIKLMRATGASAFASNHNYGQQGYSNNNYRPQQNYQRNYQQNYQPTAPCPNQNQSGNSPWNNGRDWNNRRDNDRRDDRNRRDQSISISEVTITKIDGNSITVSSNNRRGGEKEVKINRNTRMVDCYGRPINLRDLREGDRINVSGECRDGNCSMIEATVVAESCDNNRR